VKALEYLCDAPEADLDGCQNSLGYSPLHYAANLGMEEVVNYLSLRDCNLDALDPDGNTVLMRYTRL